MEKISHKVAALGGVISTTDISSEAEYKRIHRAAQRGELQKLRSGVYASPDALLDTMLDIERIVPIMPGATISSPQPSHLHSVSL